MKVSEFISYTIENHYTKNTVTNSTKNKVIITNSQDVFNYCQEMKNLPKEYLRGLYLNVKNQVIHDEIISIGTIDQSIAHPRDIFRPAVIHNAAAFILVHNHPSGDLTPSNSDIRLSQKLEKASEIMSIQFTDSIIIAGDSFVSCK